MSDVVGAMNTYGTSKSQGDSTGKALLKAVLSTVEGKANLFANTVSISGMAIDALWDNMPTQEQQEIEKALTHKSPKEQQEYIRQKFGI